MRRRALRDALIRAITYHYVAFAPNDPTAERLGGLDHWSDRFIDLEFTIVYPVTYGENGKLIMEITLK